MLRKLLATSFFALVVSASASQDLSGTYCLDLQASDNYEPIMAQMGVSYLMRKVAAFIQLQATYTQKGDTLSTLTTGPGFAMHETMHTNGQNEPSSETLLGGHVLHTQSTWSGNQLVTVDQVQMPSGKTACLTITRELKDNGRTLLISTTIKPDGEPSQRPLHRVWRKNG
ncbi:MAG: hypothetical protein JO308_00220 [Verrucomicrobia bacterium]|nr:hypothetical protein [Verrucomicrobiota bacterium]